MSAVKCISADLCLLTSHKLFSAYKAICNVMHNWHHFVVKAGLLLRKLIPKGNILLSQKFSLCISVCVFLMRLNGFLKTKLLQKPNSGDGLEALVFSHLTVSQIIYRDAGLTERQRYLLKEL